MARPHYIKGVGNIRCSIDGHIITIPNVRYIPELAESIYSLFLHIQHPEHGLESSFEEGLYLKFPSFKTKALLGMTDIYINAIPIQDVDSMCPGVDSIVSNMMGSTNDSYCNHLSEFQNALIEETTLLDNLLLSLRDYYQSVKTKCQLDYEVPAGFRQHSVHQRDLRQHRKSLFPDQPNLTETGEIIHPEITEPSATITNHTKSSSLDIKCPIV